MTDPFRANLPANLLERYADAIHNPRLTILARKLAHARAVIKSLGWPASAWGLSSPWQPRPWAERGRTSALRVVVSEDLQVGRCADGADFVLTVVSPGPGMPLWVDIAGSEHEPRSGLMRRLRAGFVGPRWA